MYLGAGSVREDVVVDDLGTVPVSYSRVSDGWVAEFSVGVDSVADLSVVHRLRAPSLTAARRAVPSAAAFLAGRHVEPITPLG